METIAARRTTAHWTLVQFRGGRPGLVGAPDVVGDPDAVLLGRVGHRQADPDGELAGGQLGGEEDLGSVSEDDMVRMTLPQDTDDDPTRHHGPPVTRDAVPSRGADTSRYLVAAVLSRADAQPSATARFGSVCPGKVAHPVFITNSVCSQDEAIAVSSPSFLTRATSIFSPARQIGTSAAVTAASACLTAIWPAVPLVVQPPQPNPTIIVSTPPMTAPQIPGFSHTGCTIMMSYLLAPRRIGESEPQCRRTAAG